MLDAATDWKADGVALAQNLDTILNPGPWTWLQ